MKGDQLELFRTAILRVLDANNTRFGLGARAVGLHLAAFGFPAPNEQEVQDELEYLARKELVTEVLKVVSRENRSWRITQAGIGFLDARA